MHRLTKISISILFLIFTFAILSSGAFAQYSIVVSKSSSQTADEAFLKDVFAGVKLKWEDGSVTQVVTQNKTETGKDFYKKFLGKSVRQVSKRWTKLALSGQAQKPINCDDDNAVKKAVAANKNAVGFVLTANLDDTVKELVKIE